MKQNFSAYRDAVNEAMIDLFGLDLSFIEATPELIAGAQEDGWTPEQFAAWHGKNEEFTTVEDTRRCDCAVCEVERERNR